MMIIPVAKKRSCGNWFLINEKKVGAGYEWKNGKARQQKVVLSFLTV